MELFAVIYLIKPFSHNSKGRFECVVHILYAVYQCLNVSYINEKMANSNAFDAKR